MALQSYRMNRNTFLFHLFYHLINLLSFLRILDVIIIVKEDSFRISSMGILKSFHNKIFATYFIPLRRAIENRIPVIDYFVYYIPTIYAVFITVYYSCYMVF